LSCLATLCEASDPNNLINMQFALELNMTMKSQKEKQVNTIMNSNFDMWKVYKCMIL